MEGEKNRKGYWLRKCGDTNYGETRACEECGYKLDASNVVWDLGFNMVRDILQEMSYARVEFSAIFSGN